MGLGRTGYRVMLQCGTKKPAESIRAEIVLTDGALAATVTEELAEDSFSLQDSLLIPNSKYRF